MELIPSRDVLDFLSQSAPRAWVKRLLFALIMDNDVTPYATGAKSVAKAYALGEILEATGGAADKKEARKRIDDRFPPEIAAKLRAAERGDYVEQVADEWESPEDAQPIDSGFFLYATQIDWEKGIIETELDDVNGYDPNFFDDKSSLLSSSFAQPGVAPLRWTVCGSGRLDQTIASPFVFDWREIAQRRVAA